MQTISHLKLQAERQRTKICSVFVHYNHSWMEYSGFICPIREQTNWNNFLRKTNSRLGQNHISYSPVKHKKSKEKHGWLPFVPGTLGQFCRIKCFLGYFPPDSEFFIWEHKDLEILLGCHSIAKLGFSSPRDNFFMV